MKQEKVIKTRKIHVCDICKTDIFIGSNAIYIESKTPEYDIKTSSYDYEGKQIGICYNKYYFHEDCIDNVRSNN